MPLVEAGLLPRGRRQAGDEGSIDAIGLQRLAVDDEFVG